MLAKKRIKMTAEGRVKMVLSGLLLVFSLIVTIITREPLVFFGMLFSSIGDFAIADSRGAIYEGEKSKNNFYAGVSAFAFAHLIYGICMCMMGVIKDETSLVIKAVFCILFVSSAIAFLLGLLSNKNATMIYAICLIATWVIAFKFSIVAVIGYSLFIASDLILALFEDKSPKWQYAIWATYVPAQALILASFLLK